MNRRMFLGILGSIPFIPYVSAKDTRLPNEKPSRWFHLPKDSNYIMLKIKAQKPAEVYSDKGELLGVTLDNNTTFNMYVENVKKIRVETDGWVQVEVVEITYKHDEYLTYGKPKKVYRR